MNLETERLRIRMVQTEDAEAIFRYRSDPETKKYLSLVPTSVDDIVDFIGRTASEINLPGTWFQLVIIEKASGALVGDIGLHFLKNAYENEQVEIGYTLDPEFRGKGFALEALRSVIDYVFSSLKKHRIIASIDPVNTASIKLVEKLGFRKEAHFIESLFFHGEWVDDIVYALLSREWKN